MDEIELLKTLPRKKPTPEQIEEARKKILANYKPAKKPKLSLEEIAMKCPTCKQGYFRRGDGVHVCKRKTCKYLAPSKASSWWIRYGDKQ